MDDQAFYVQLTGQVESGNYGTIDNLYCRYSFHYGPDWVISGGIDTGLSQIAKRSVESEEGVIWNFPIDITFRATSVHGWPRMAISVYGIDFLGRDIIRGYGSALIPLTVGQHVIDVDTYAPLATSTFNQAVSWIMGNPPEFFDSKFVCQGEGREVTRVQYAGTVRLKVHVLTKCMQSGGYSSSDASNVLTVT